VPNSPEPSMGEVWDVDFDPQVGREQGGVRPALVISNNQFNRVPNGLYFVAPITGRDRDIPLHVRMVPPEGGLSKPSVVNVGNPHCIFFVDDVEAHDLARFGPLLEHNQLFPERANISLAQVTGPNSLRLRTWERGAGLTKACGTAACAAAVAAVRRGLTGREVRVTLPGGDLVIGWREGDDHILMTGPFALDYQGTLPPELLQPAPAASG